MLNKKRRIIVYGGRMIDSYYWNMNRSDDFNDTSTLIWKNIEEIQNFFISSNYHNFPINTKIIINKNKIFFHFIFQSMDINLDINRFTT